MGIYLYGVWFDGMRLAGHLEFAMKYLALLTLATTALFAGHAHAAAPTYKLTYNAIDGSITLDTYGETLYNYIIITTGSLLEDDGFIEANHILIPDAPGPQLQSATSSDDELSQSDFNGWFGLGPQNLGNVLPAGLSETTFYALIDPLQTKYVRQLGTNGFPDFFYNFEIVYNVPEPGSIALFGAGLALLMKRPRR